jgi:hypothetical protein
MLERSHLPNDLDATIQHIQSAERVLAAQQLIQIASQLADLAKSAQSLVGPIGPLPANNSLDLPPS